MENRKFNEKPENIKDSVRSEELKKLLDNYLRSNNQTPGTANTVVPSSSSQAQNVSRSSQLPPIPQYISPMQNSLPPILQSNSPTQVSLPPIASIFNQQSTTTAKERNEVSNTVVESTTTQRMAIGNQNDAVNVPVYDARALLSQWYDVKTDAEIYLIPIRDMKNNFKDGIRKLIEKTKDFIAAVNLNGGDYFLVTGNNWMKYGKKTSNEKYNYVISTQLNEQLISFENKQDKIEKRFSKACEKANAQATGAFMQKQAIGTVVPKKLPEGIQEEVRYHISHIIKEKYKNLVSGEFPKISIIFFTKEPKDCLASLYKRSNKNQTPIKCRLFEGIFGKDHVWAFVLDESDTLTKPQKYKFMQTKKEIDDLPASQISNLKAAIQSEKGTDGYTRNYLDECIKGVLNNSKGLMTRKKRKGENLDADQQHLTENDSERTESDNDSTPAPAKKQKTEVMEKSEVPMEDARDVNQYSQVASFTLFPPVPAVDSDEETEEEVIITKKSEQKKS